MKRILRVAVIGGILAATCLFYLDNLSVEVVNAIQNGRAAYIIVNRMPLSNESKIRWWVENEHEIIESYHLELDDKQSDRMYFIYSFDDGYQELKDKDRLCFSNVKPPKNCIEKDAYMWIYVSRKNGTSYFLDQGEYIITAENKIKRLEDNYKVR